MSALPLVSICIPSYNSSSFIKETIGSLLAQTYSNIEIIVSDDCSKDNTVEIVRSFQDARIKLFQNERNLGVEGNWNNSLKLSSGVYLKMMGADDILSPDCIEEQVKAFEDPANSDVVLISSHKKVIDKNGRGVISLKFPGKGKIDGLAALKKSLRRGTNIIGEPVAGLFRASILERSGYYNGENIYMIDLDLWSRILKFGNLYVIDKTLFCFRISGESLSAGIGFRQFTLYNLFITKLFADKSFKITAFDRRIAQVMSLVKAIIRQAFFLISSLRK